MNYLFTVLLMLAGLHGLAQSATHSLAKPVPTLIATDQFTVSRLQGYLWCRTDSMGMLSPSVFRQEMRTGSNGEICPIEVPNFGDKSYRHWIGLKLRSEFSAAQMMVLEFDFIGADELTFWVYEGDKLARQSPVVSWSTPLHQRDVQHRVPAFRFAVQPGQTYDLLIRLWKQDGVLVAPLALFTETRFAAHTIRTSLTHGVATGCLVLAIILGLSFWVLTRQIQYGYYAWYSLGILLFLLEEQGYLNLVAVGKSDLFANPNAWALCSLFAMIGHTLFIVWFLQLNQPATRRWAWAGWAICAICVFLLTYLLAGYSSDEVHSAALLLNSVYALLLFAYLFVGFRYKRPETVLYLVASGPFFLTVLWVCLATFGLLPEGSLLYTLLNYSPVWEIALLCVGLAFSFSRTQHQRLMALEETSRLRTETLLALDNAQESERRRIAQDLHDDVGNTLAAAKGMLGTISRKLLIQVEFPEVLKAQLLIDKAGQDLRTISHNLLPVEFEKYKLSDVIRQSVERANNSAFSIQFEYVHAGTERQLTPERSLVLYRIVNELINNILKHSEAKTAIVQTIFQRQSLVVTVEDDGKGFQSVSSGISSTGIGLKNVTSRSIYIGATLDISSNTSGTCVIIEVPYV